MRFHPVDFLRQHLFFKIALVFCLSMLAILILFPLTLRFILIPQRFPVFQKVAVDNAEYLIQDIGIPPDIGKALRIEQKLGVRIRIRGPGLNWAGKHDMIDFPDIKLVPVPQRPRALAGFTRHGFCAIIERDSYRFLLVLQPREENILELGRIFLYFLGVYLVLIIFVQFFVIQWLLRDVRVLSEGMRQIGSGVLSHRMSSRRQDELGRLVSSFNTMSEKIGEMIRNREQLLLDVSHELRSPLTRIKVALEFLDSGDKTSTIRDDVRELETMIAELLESERLSSPYGGLKLGEYPLAELIHDVCQGFRARPPGITIRPIPQTMLLVLDRERFKIALRNILDNSLRYSQMGGQKVEIDVTESTAEIIIAVQDYGPGIPEKEIPHIFEPFYRIDKSRSKETGGYGLGLNLVHKIMTAHGGRITIRSRLNLGTTVFLIFPRQPS